MRRLLILGVRIVFLCSFIVPSALYSQEVDSAAIAIDTVKVAVDTVVAEPDSVSTTITDKLTLAVKDSVRKDTVDLAKSDSIIVVSHSEPSVPIAFEPDSAALYLSKLIKKNNLWHSDDDGLKLSIKKLLNHYAEPFDSVSRRLRRFPFDSLKVKPSSLQLTDTLPVRWLTSSSFIIDTVKLERSPIILKKKILTKETIVKRHTDTVVVGKVDSTMKEYNGIGFLEEVGDSITTNVVDTIADTAVVSDIKTVVDTVVYSVVDTTYLAEKGVRVFELIDGAIPQSIIPRRRWRTVRFAPDSSGIVFAKTISVLIGDSNSPFNIVPSVNTSDSLKHAVRSILSYAAERDSMLLQINDIVGRRTPLWLSQGKDDMIRYWVKNSKNDSITIWIGNPSRKGISLVLEEDVNVERLERKMVDDIPFTSLKPNRQLAEVKLLREIPIYWHSELVSSFALNGNFLSKYWAKGGETTVSSMLDINGLTEYNNKEAKTKWVTNGRLRYGTTWTEAQKFRTNTDIIEVNSQFNKSIRNKIDFSSGVYMRTQLAKGYNYPNDSIPVSKFLNPGTFTVSSGFEFKPAKNLSLNFSPLSYKNTFVIDTITIDQTNHGIESGRKVRHEMGGQLVVNSLVTIFKDMKIKNSVRLFSNYLLNPENVDVDWEFSLEKQISWYFTIKLNSHLIYDDDIIFPLFDDRMKEKPILDGSGEQKKGAKAQFSQFVGLTLSFKI